jgi:hypothetical protein
MLKYSNIEEAYTNAKPKSTSVCEYYRAVSRDDGKFDLYTYIDGKRTGSSKIVEYGIVKSLRKDNAVTVEGAWVG